MGFVARQRSVLALHDGRSIVDTCLGTEGKYGLHPNDLRWRFAVHVGDGAVEGPFGQPCGRMFAAACLQLGGGVLWMIFMQQKKLTATPITQNEVHKVMFTCFTTLPESFACCLGMESARSLPVQPPNSTACSGGDRLPMTLRRRRIESD